jgi:hypothetical protein
VTELVHAASDLEWAYIDRELRPLAELKEAPEIPSELEKRRRELER